jgi:hypothetical protein
MAMQCERFTIHRVATCGHEILDPDGRTIAWAADGPWALVIAALLNRVESDGLSSLDKPETRKSSP